MSIIAAAACGVLTWTLLEYLIHRWMGHGRRLRGNPFGVEHTRHHAEGNYFAPTYKKLIVAAVVIAILSLPAIAIAGTAHGLAYVLGLVGFYGMYEVLHRREHTHPGIGAYGRWARRHHFHHHFVNNRSNHGVTTPIWDMVFGTLEQPTIIKVPRKLCMAWLLDPATNDVQAAHAATYQLAKPPR
jgi:sterol desaturase/sphingolipid hydroxylase (fatty acid hydroxylase superfamily)